MKKIKKKKSIEPHLNTYKRFVPVELGTIDQERRNHFYLGIDKFHYHKHYDDLYYSLMCRRQKNLISKEIDFRKS